MLFVTKTGKYINVKRLSFINDREYYKALIKSKGFDIQTTDIDNSKRILDIINLSNVKL